MSLSNSSHLVVWRRRPLCWVGSELWENKCNSTLDRVIRASVDALCRDGTSEISRDPRTKRLQTRRESLARPSKHTNNNLLDSYLAVHKPSSFLPASSLPRENPLTRDFHNFVSSYSSSSSSLSSSSSSSSINPLSPY